MNNQIRELSIDDLDTVSGGEGLGSLGSLIQLETTRLEGEKQSTTASTQAPVRQSIAKPTPIIRL
jgi:hypothetical protein